MRRILRIARREYKVAVRTKGFIISLVVAPLLMGGSALVVMLTEDRVDTTDQVLAVVDHSGAVVDGLAEAAEERNTNWIFNEETGKKNKPAYIIEAIEPDTAAPAAQRLELSNRVRRGEIHAFLEVGPEVVQQFETAFPGAAGIRGSCPPGLDRRGSGIKPGTAGAPPGLATVGVFN